jgi:hypothetical protein
MNLKKKNLPGRGLTKVEKHCSRASPFSQYSSKKVIWNVNSCRAEIPTHMQAESVGVHSWAQSSKIKKKHMLTNEEK